MPQRGYSEDSSSFNLECDGSASAHSPIDVDNTSPLTASPGNIHGSKVSLDPWGQVINMIQNSNQYGDDRSHARAVQVAAAAVRDAFPKNSIWRHRIEAAGGGATVAPPVLPPAVEVGVSAIVPHSLAAARGVVADANPPRARAAPPKRKRMAEALIERHVAPVKEAPAKKQKHRWALGDILLCLRSSGDKNECHVQKINKQGYEVKLHTGGTKEIEHHEADEYLFLPPGKDVPDTQPGYPPRPRPAAPVAAVAPAAAAAAGTADATEEASAPPARRQRQARQAPAVRPALTAYKLYSAAKFAAVQQQMDTEKGVRVARGDVQKRISEMWKQLDKKSAEWAEYAKQAQEDKQRYQREMGQQPSSGAAAAATKRPTRVPPAAIAAPVLVAAPAAAAAAAPAAPARTPPVRRALSMAICDDDGDSE